MDPNNDGPVAEVLDEVRLLFHRAGQVGERLHRRERLTMGRRGVLEFVHRNGPSTVPGIAARRFVSRQHIQMLVHGLLERRLVELATNPAHRRSALVALTPAGRQTIQRMKARERRLAAGLDPGLGPARLRSAARTLRRLRAALGGEA